MPRLSCTVKIIKTLNAVVFIPVLIKGVNLPILFLNTTRHFPNFTYLASFQTVHLLGPQIIM